MRLQQEILMGVLRKSGTSNDVNGQNDSGIIDKNAMTLSHGEEYQFSR